MTFERNFGRVILNNEKTYMEFTHMDEFRDFDNIYFDFYRNDSLLIKQKYFDSTDGEPKISDIKIREYEGMFYVTNFDSTKVKIICDEKLNIIYPVKYGEKEDSAISRIPKVKELLKTKKLTLGRW